MTAIVYQVNKKTGITYVYESVSYWDKEKKQSRARRKLIGKLDPIEALEIYRNKDIVEKEFGNLNDRLNFSRPGVSSDQYLNAKQFVEFVALIYLSYIKKQMQEKKLFKKMTIQELLDEIDIIECFQQEGNKLRVGEITKKQADIFEAMEIKDPT